MAERIKALKGWREKKARELNLAPGVVFSNTLIDQIGEKNPRVPMDLESIPDLRQWQRQVFGAEILEVISSLRPPDK